MRRRVLNYVHRLPLATLHAAAIRVRAAHGGFWRRRHRVEITAVQGTVDLFIALNDADVVPRLHERDTLSEDLRIVHTYTLGPPLDPRYSGVVRRQDVGPLLVLAEELTQVNCAELNTHVRLVQKHRVPYRIVQLSRQPLAQLWHHLSQPSGAGGRRRRWVEVGFLTNECRH